MYTLSKTFRFEASHQLTEHDGKCARLHGHSWEMTIFVRGAHLHSSGPKQGMLLDYGDIKAAVQPIVDQYLDHHHLNDTLPVYPTSENIARWVYSILKPVLPELSAVQIKETCTAAALLEEDLP